MGISVLGFFSLLLALVEVSALQVGLLLAAMFGMHKYFRDKLPETRYLEFDFDSFDKKAFHDLTIRLAIIFCSSTIVIHMLFYIFINRNRYHFLYGTVLLILESAAIAVGLLLLLKLDWLRLAILTGLSAILYLLLKWILVGQLLYGI